MHPSISESNGTLSASGKGSNMSWIIKTIINQWLWVAVLASLFWGVYGWRYEKVKKIKKAGNFISEFIGSFAGWCCFYILTCRLEIPYSKIEAVDIWLIIGAVVGMAGYSYRIVELIEKNK